MGKNIVILGSTGSIGRRTVDVIRALGTSWPVVGLTAGSNWQALAEQAKEFIPRLVAIADEQAYAPLSAALKDLPIEVLGGESGLAAAASVAEADLVLCAIVGSASIKPAFAALRAGKDLGLASKEALVVGGQLLLAEARKSNAKIIPVDSEHSAIFQAMQAGRTEDVVGITLTASGGPFLHQSPERIQSATLEEVLAHPTWSMGPKVTIDSATMMNKGLEVIEAHYLFDQPVEQIRVVVHPESIVHSLVEFSDGVMIAQLSEPDMAIPIQYALTWPTRRQGIGQKVDLGRIGKLTFLEPDHRKFPALDLAYSAAEREGTAPAVLNAANEQAVDCFMQGKIPFGKIVKLTEQVLERHSFQAGADLAQLLKVDRWARNEVLRCLNR